MTKPNKDFAKLLKEEADHSLFHNLDFDGEIKERVRGNVKHSMNSKFKRLISNFAKRNMFRTAAVATIFILLFGAVFVIQDLTTNNLANIEDSNISTFQGGQESNSLPDPNMIQYRDLKTIEEAKQMFGENILIPTTTPDNYKLERIHTIGSKKEEVNKVIFTYVNDENTFLAMVDKRVFADAPKGFNEVNINGVTGYLQSENGITELLWSKGDFHYEINGLITSDEAVNLANSFK